MIDILGAFNDIGPFVDDISDHKPLMAVYRTSLPANSQVKSMPTHTIRDVLLQVPHTSQGAGDAVCGPN